MNPRPLFRLLLAATFLASGAWTPTASGAAGGRSSDPRVLCIRDTEKTCPPRTISRKLRDRHVEACLDRKARSSALETA